MFEGLKKKLAEAVNIFSKKEIEEEEKKEVEEKIEEKKEQEVEQHPESKDQEEKQERDCPNEAKFLANHREDKVGMVFRQKIKLPLRPHTITFAP